MVPALSRPAATEELLEVLLGNPYDRDLRQQRQRLQAASELPATVAAWLAWWRALPALVRGDEAAAIALCVAVIAPTPDGPTVPEAAARVLREELSAEVVRGSVDLAVRAATVTRILDEMVGDSEAMWEVRRKAWAAAFGARLDRVPALVHLVRQTPVLILGETGTGKELVARALCRSMPELWGDKRPEPAPYASAHLAALPPTLVQSELFGYVRGAYTGATRDQPGILERCHLGVVFLDEVAELPADTQVALLRTLQEGKVRRLGDAEERDAAPRVISATHKDLEALVDEGRFRLDLYHRLSSVVIRLPPLRERQGDIPLLVEKELRERVAPTLRGELKERAERFLERAADYRWPGNVRELQKVVYTLALGLEPVLAGRAQRPGALPAELASGSWTLDQALSWYCAHVSERAGSIGEAARTLAIDRGTLRRYLGKRSHGA